MNNCKYYISCNDKKKYCLYDSPKFSNQNKYAYLLTFFDTQIEIVFTRCHLMGLNHFGQALPKKFSTYSLAENASMWVHRM